MQIGPFIDLSLALVVVNSFYLHPIYLINFGQCPICILIYTEMLGILDLRLNKPQSIKIKRKMRDQKYFDLSY